MKKICAIALVFGVLATLTGCGKEQAAVSTSSVKSTKQSTAITTAELDKIAKAKKPYKMALIVKTRNNPFFDPMIKAAEAEAKALGISLEVQSPAQEADKERQFAIIQDVTAKGVDAILITPADSKGVVPALKQAQDKGILVINLDNRIDMPTADAAGLKLAGYVGVSNEDGGKIAGEAMVKALKEKGNIAILEGIRSADNAQSRKRGFEAGIGSKLNVVASETAEWDTQKAYDKTQSILASQKDLNGIFCANDKMALGAIKAIREAGHKGQLVVIGFDAIPDVIPYIKSGEMYGTVVQPPDQMGKYGVRMALGMLDGSLAKDRELILDLKMLTKETLK